MAYGGACEEGMRLQEDARCFIEEFFPGGWDQFPPSVVRLFVQGMISICEAERARLHFDHARREAVRLAGELAG